MNGKAVALQATRSSRLLVVMLIAARTTILDHREIAAVLVTYGVFITGVLGLTWAIA